MSKKARIPYESPILYTIRALYPENRLFEQRALWIDSVRKASDRVITVQEKLRSI